MRRLLLFLLLPSAVLLAPVATPAQAPPAASAEAGPATGALTPQQAQQAIEVLQDEQKRAQLIATLRVIANASPAASPPATGATPQRPASAAALAPDSLGVQLLAQLSQWVGHITAEATAIARAVTEFPLLWHWLERVLADPADQAALLDALWRLIVILAVALGFERLLSLGLRRPLATLGGHAFDNEGPEHDEIAIAPLSTQPAVPPAVPPAVSPAVPPPSGGPEAESRNHQAGAWRRLRRLPLALIRLLLELVPVGVFAAVGNVLAASPLGGTLTTQLVTLALVNAYVGTRALMCVVRMLLSPGVPRLRLLHIGDAAAAYGVRWARRIAVVALFGGALAAIAQQLGMEEAGHDALARLISLIVAILLIAVVVQCRDSVARHLRPAADSSGAFSRLRQWLAGTWHDLAIIAIVIGWLIWAAGVRNGLGGVRFLADTAAVLIAARLVAIIALGTLDRSLRSNPQIAQRFPEFDTRAGRYYRPARVVLLAAIAAATLVALLQVWGAGALGWFASGAIGARLLSAAVTIVIAAAAAAILWESVNAALDRRLSRLSQQGASGRSARLRTLLPILRTALLVAILTIVGLTALSEIGVNVAPLLAGAGIVGIAVGFGSQKLVQDFITGMFLLLENAIQVGDAVTVAGLSGNVEQLSVRTIWLRAGDGAVHIIPFSSVTSITNTSRGIGNAAIAVTVALEEDPDRVGAAMQEIAAAMREDPVFSPQMRSGLQGVGVDRLRASGVTLTGQIECTDSGRTPVQREFNRRMKQRFQELGIKIADPPP